MFSLKKVTNNMPHVYGYRTVTDLLLSILSERTTGN